MTLINHAYVKKSPIHGFGVFAAKPLQKNEIIEECYVLYIEDNISLNNYTFHVDKKDEYGLALGAGCIYNHAINPNATYEIIDDIMVVTALTQIPKDEEIFISYGRDWASQRNIEMKVSKKSWARHLVKKTSFLPKMALITALMMSLPLAIRYVSDYKQQTILKRFQHKVEKYRLKARRPDHDIFAFSRENK